MEQFMIETAREAGRIAMEYRKNLSGLAVDSKDSEKDIVTEADKAIEEQIRRAIASEYPDHGVTGEEQGVTGDSEYRWIVDPIDGTVAFLHGQYNFSVSLALMHKGELILGAVYAPALDDLFTAAKGKGAKLNGQPIHVTREDKLVNSVFATGFACLRSDYTPNNLPLFCDMAPRLRGIRRYGSAALDLCSVACGQLEGYWEKYIHIYDVAAGMLIVREAGGTVTDYRGGEDGLPGEILATNGLVHSETLEIFSHHQF